MIVKRPLVAFAAGAVASFSVGYVAGYVLEMAFSWAISAGLSYFGAFVAVLIGLMLSVYYGVRAGVAVSDYINSGKIDAHYAVVRAWFMPRPIEVVHA